MKILRSLISVFSPYAHPFERKVDRFFKGVKSTSNVLNVRKKLLKLMQTDLVAVNVWLEKKYKGYVYLKKGVRRKMYANTAKIVKDFKAHRAGLSVSVKDLKALLANRGLSVHKSDEVKLVYLAQIMDYLRPGHKYKYIKTASFGKLLNNPEKELLQGDCNQIVTLYIYLFSLNFKIEDLQIKILPNHVCLHFKGIDIEATTASFEKYAEYEHILPVTEIISTNLLDLTDFREKVQKISERDFLKAAQLAYAISSLKAVVEQNVKGAYNNLARSALLEKNFDSAIFFYEKNHDQKMVDQVYRQAAVYFAEKNDYSRAKTYAKKTKDRDFVGQIEYREAAYYYNHDKLDKALKIFRSLGEDKMVKACYAKKYNELQKRIDGDKTLADLKRNKAIYKRMYELAGKMGDDDLRDRLRKTLSQL